MGNGGVTSIRGGSQQKFAAGQQFDIMELGPFNVPERNTLVPVNVWDMVLAAQQEVTLPAEPSSEVLQLAELRGAARARRNWEVADQLREQIMALGWYVKDTPQGFQLEPIAE